MAGEGEQAVRRFEEVLAKVPAGGVAWFDGDPASPSFYRPAVGIVLSRPVTLKAVRPHGATWAGSGIGRRAMLVQPLLGGTVCLDGGTLDASRNGGGPADRCVDLASQAIPYRFRAANQRFKDWNGDEGVAIAAWAPSFRGTLELCNGTRLSTVEPAIGGIYVASWAEGGLDIESGATVLERQSASNFGAIVVNATAPGVTARIVDHDTSTTLDAVYNGSSPYGIHLRNFARALVDGGTHDLLGNPAGVYGKTIAITTNGAGDASELPIDGSGIRNVVARNTTNGGSVLQIGDETSGDANKANRLFIEDSRAYGDAASAAGGLHCLFMSRTRNSWIRRCYAERGGLGAVIKDSSDGLAQDIELRDMHSAYLTAKGAVRFTFERVRCLATTGRFASMLRVLDSDAGVHSTGVCAASYFEVAGAEKVTFVFIDSGNDCALTGNHFHLSSGSLSDYPFRINGESFTTFAAFNAAYPGNTANFE